MVVSKLIKRTDTEIVYEYLPEGNLRPGYIYIDLNTMKTQVEVSPDDYAKIFLKHACHGINSQYIQNNEFPEKDFRCWG